MNTTQILNILAPVVAFLASWLAQHIPFIDAAAWSGFINSGLLLITGGFLGYINRNTAMITQVAKMPEVNKVLTDTATANAIPANNVVAGQ